MVDLQVGQELTVADLFDSANISDDFMDDFTERLKSGSANVDNCNGECGYDFHLSLVYLENDCNVHNSVVRITDIDSI